MTITTDTATFDTDHLKMIDRVNSDLVYVRLESSEGPDTILLLQGLSARQAWCQVTEQAETLEQLQ